MAVEYKHNEYFRRRFAVTDDDDEKSTLYDEQFEDDYDDSLVYELDTFTNVEDAKTKCGFHNTYLTSNSPTITYALEDSDKTLKVTLEFDSSDAQQGWKTAVTNMSDSSTAWYNSDIEWFKIEWLGPDGSVSNTHEFDPWPDE
jgi:hypothetical protein